MKRTITALGLTLLTTLGAGLANAATLGLETEAPIAEASFAVVEYLEFGPDGDLFTFGGEVDYTDGIDLTGFAEIGFGVGFSLTDPEGDAAGGFSLFDDTGHVLGGDLEAVGFFEDTIELLFGTLTGSGTGVFGDQVLATIIFDDPLGPNPFTSFLDGESYVASISLASVRQLPPTVPLPAGLVLILSGLGGFVMIGRRQRA